MPAKPQKATAYADSRPRIHLWPGRPRQVRFSFGPIATRSSQAFETLGGAVDAAFMHLGKHGPAVIIVEEEV